MSDESPSDRFKSVLAGASRAIAHEKEIEVNWTADAPSSTGGTFRVPMPGRSLPRDAAMQARGYADSFALKLQIGIASCRERVGQSVLIPVVAVTLKKKK